MSQNIDLTQGSIAGKIFKFTMPLLGTSLINMLYSFVDMVCIGALGSGAVAAVGTAGFFLWFSNASSSMARIGAQVKLSHAFGRKDFAAIRSYAGSAIWVNLLLGTLVGAILFFGRTPVIAFFRLGDPDIIRSGEEYLAILALSLPFTYINPVISASLNSIGNSRTPFLFNSAGLIFNIVFDVILIFGIGPFPALGVRGAAIATALAQVFVFTLLVSYNARAEQALRFSLLQAPALGQMREICAIGLPSALQATLYCCYSIVLARIIASFGPVSIAVQKVGSQIESIAWMTADGFAIAATAFVGQNFGIGNHDRIRRGIRVILGYAFAFGSLSMILLVFFGRPVFSIFLKDAASVAGGVDYLRILGFSQALMSLEIVSIGIFNGYGQTKIPAAISIILTGARIPIALFLSATALGVNGIWWAISGTSIVKGIVLPIAFWLYQQSLRSTETLPHTRP